MNINRIVIARHNAESHLLDNLYLPELFIQLFNLNAIKHNVFDCALMIHRHVFYFGTLKYVIAFCFVKDVFQVVHDVVAHVLIRIALKPVIFFK